MLLCSSPAKRGLPERRCLDDAQEILGQAGVAHLRRWLGSLLRAGSALQTQFKLPEAAKANSES